MIMAMMIEPTQAISSTLWRLKQRWWRWYHNDDNDDDSDDDSVNLGKYHNHYDSDDKNSVNLGEYNPLKSQTKIVKMIS